MKVLCVHLAVREGIAATCFSSGSRRGALQADGRRAQQPWPCPRWIRRLFFSRGLRRRRRRTARSYGCPWRAETKEPKGFPHPPPAARGRRRSAHAPGRRLTIRPAPMWRFGPRGFDRTPPVRATVHKVLEAASGVEVGDHAPHEGLRLQRVQQLQHLSGAAQRGAKSGAPVVLLTCPEAALEAALPTAALHRSAEVGQCRARVAKCDPKSTNSGKS